MKSFHSVFASLFAGFSVVLFAVVGCGQSEPGPIGSASPTTVDADDHPSEGPHHGELIELGNEAYHAELVHDDAAGSVTIYLLDSEAKKSVPIDTAELLVNLSHEGQAEQFKLAANPDVGDPPGMSSRFTSTDTELAEELDHSEAELVVMIGEKQFRGAIAHDHDHEGPSH